MSSLNKAQIKSLIITPSITACISLCASIILIVSIFRSNLRLSTVYRRLVFGLSIFDIIVSAAHLFSSLPMPAGSIWGAMGNSVTCDLQGFISTIGLCGTLLYSLSLTLYFLLVVKFKMPEAKIKKNVEPFLHTVPILYSLTISTVIYASNHYNASGTICWIAPKPLNCEHDPEVECLSTGNTDIFRWIGGGAVVVGVFIGNCSMLAVILCSYRSHLKKNQSYGNSASPRVIQRDEEAQTQSAGSCCTFCPMKQCPIIGNQENTQGNSPERRSVLADYLSRPSRAAVKRLEEISYRAAAYVVGYTLSFMFMMIYRVIDTHGSGPPPFVFMYLTRFFFPLQGFFNVLIYTYPHVTSYKKTHTDCNWFQAFWQVIKSGGDDDRSRNVGGRRRESLRKQQKVLEQSQYKRRGSEVGSVVIPTSPNYEI